MDFKPRLLDLVPILFFIAAYGVVLALDSREARAGSVVHVDWPHHT